MYVLIALGSIIQAGCRYILTADASSGEKTWDLKVLMSYCMYAYKHST